MQPNQPQWCWQQGCECMHPQWWSYSYAVLDDGADRSILLPQAAQQLGLATQPETLRTVRHDIVQLDGASVSFEISPISQPEERHIINIAFTAEYLGLSENTHPVKQLQEQYHHLGGNSLQTIDYVCPLVLIGSDYAHFITATEAILMGLPGGPLAVHTRLGWALQGPASLIQWLHDSPSKTDGGKALHSSCWTLTAGQSVHVY